MAISGVRGAGLSVPVAAPVAVSVALCTHNGLPFVVEQVESILGQSVPPAQVVLSDDASSDGTVAAVRALFVGHGGAAGGAMPELVVLENAVARGVTANFEQAVRACSGDLVALCDQDDVWPPDRLERIVRVFAGDPGLTLLHHDARLVDEGGVPLGVSLAQAIGLTGSERRRVARGGAFGVLLRRNVVTGATTVFRRGLVGVAVPFPASWVHDEWLAMVASLVGRVGFLPELLLDYRQHAANQIGARKPTLADRVSRVAEPRGVRNRRLAERAAALAERVGRLDAVPPRAVRLATLKCRHERWRGALPARRLRRIFPVLGAVLRGRYFRFGRARFDVVRDLFQPAG